jgi:hypothetical protein
LIAPPFSIEKDCILALQDEFPNFTESDHFKRELIEQKPNLDTSAINFIFLTSLKGLEDFAESHTEKIYYLIFNYT